MSEQTSIPVDETRPSTGRCAWCDAPANNRIVIEKERKGRHSNGTMVVKRHAIEAWVCAHHHATLKMGDDE